VHRSLPHPSELVIEAWAQTPGDCFAEAVAALVENVADPGEGAPRRWRGFRLGPGSDAELLALLLDEAIFVMDTEGLVPCRTRVDEHADGWLAGAFGVVPVSKAAIGGPAPKATSYHELGFGPASGGWLARATIDV